MQHKRNRRGVMMKKEKKVKFDSYIEDVSDKEQEEIDSYMDEEIENHIKQKVKEEKRIQKENERILEEEYDNDDLDEYEIENDFEEEKKEDYEEYLEPNKKTILNKIMNIIFILLFVLFALAIIDIICVTKFEKGPFFAIPIHTYDDGGTKEYYGLGYKVIKYNQTQGRRDTELGTWSLKYDVDPEYVEMIDLAIDFQNDPEITFDSYYKKLLVVTGNLKKINKDKNEITLEYLDEDGKYTTELICKMETEKDKLDLLEPNYETSVMGTMMDYHDKTVYLENCFAEQ